MPMRLYAFIILVVSFPLPAHAEPTTVIHILNWHYVTQEEFAKDLGIELGDYSHLSNELGVYAPPAKDKTITPIIRYPASIQKIILKDQKELDEKYSAFLDDVEAVQEQQLTVLRSLIKKHKLKGVYLEGLTEKSYKRVLKTIETIKKDEKAKPTSVDPDDEFAEFDNDEFFNAVIAAINKTHLLELGAAGQLVVKGELKTLIPAEDSKAFEAANPFQSDGTVVFDKKADEAREDAIVRNLLKSDGVVVIVLGGDHDLADNLKRIGSGCKYERVAVPKYREVVE